MAIKMTVGQLRQLVESVVQEMAGGGDFEKGKFYHVKNASGEGSSVMEYLKPSEHSGRFVFRGSGYLAHVEPNHVLGPATPEEGDAAVQQRAADLKFFGKMIDTSREGT